MKRTRTRSLRYDGCVEIGAPTMSLTTTERVYQKLKQQIITCRVAPGVSLSEQELCERFDASRTPVREACRYLETERLISIVPYRGYTVTPVNMQDFYALHEMQLIIDPAAAALAAIRATTVQLEAIEQSGMYPYKPGSQESYFTFLQKNFDFHVQIAAATRNEHLQESVVSVQTRLMRFFYLIISMDAFGPDLMDEHGMLVDALKRRDAEAARTAAVNHVRCTNMRGSVIFTDPNSVNAASLEDLTLTTTGSKRSH